MRPVKFTDEEGFKHIAYILDSMHDWQAREGIEFDPPDLRRLDWDNIARELYNLLVDRELVTLQHVQEAGNGLSNAIVTVLKSKIVDLYKEQPGFEPSLNGHINGKLS